MGLTNLRRPTAAPPTKQAAAEAYDFGAALSDTLKSLGAALPVQPAGTIPELPADWSTLTSRDVGRLLSEFAGWLAYLRPESARRKSEAAILRADVEVAKKLGRPAVDIAVLTREMVRATALADVVESLAASVRVKRDAASREITRLGLDVEPGLQQQRRWSHEDH